MACNSELLLPGRAAGTDREKTSTNPDYCVRVTANDGELVEKYLREFQDNEKTIATILTRASPAPHVIPAQAGIQSPLQVTAIRWIPACVGMTYRPNARAVAHETE